MNTIIITIIMITKTLLVHKNSWILIGLFLCLACSSSGRWRCDHMTGSAPSYRSNRLVYQKAPSDPYSLELLRMEHTLGAYLVLYSLSPSAEKETVITLTINGATHKSIGQGSKRIALDTPTTRLIIESLKKNLPITIHIRGEVVVIEPSDFEKKLPYFLEGQSMTEKMLDYIF